MSSIHVEYDARRRRRVASLSGSLLDEDLEVVQGRLRERHDAAGDADDLVDLSGVTQVGVTRGGLRQLADLLAPRAAAGRRARLAIVAPRDLLYGVSRMFQLMLGDAADAQVAVFRRLDDASSWLDAARC